MTPLEMATLTGDKFSPNLCAYVKKWTRRLGKTVLGAVPNVYRHTDGSLWIGFLDDVDGSLIGSRLVQVLCVGAKTESFCNISVRGPKIIPDFWQQYAADGRCAIDREHSMYFVGDHTRWTEDGDHRSCKWCGKASQRLKRWTEEIPRQSWELETPPAQ